MDRIMGTFTPELRAEGPRDPMPPLPTNYHFIHVPKSLPYRLAPTPSTQPSRSFVVYSLFLLVRTL